VIRACSAGLALLALTGCRSEPQAPPRPPTLFLLTGLPIAFGEGFTLDAPPSPVMSALEHDYRVQLIDGPEELSGGGVLLAAQPRALTAERLVALDKWVRGGGRLLLLADPRLTWPSALALGDKQRPPASFADTGLLAHWGLRSEAPLPSATAPVRFALAGQAVTSDSPGQLQHTGGPCQVAVDERSADCRLGRGRALVVADADFLRQADGLQALSALLDSLNR
jgi:hypothetical protein